MTFHSFLFLMVYLQNLYQLFYFFIGRRYNTNYSNIFPEFLLRDLAKQLPVTLDEILNSVSGVTAYKLDRYKQEFIQFLDITMKYTAILASKYTYILKHHSSYFLKCPRYATTGEELVWGLTDI